MDDPRASAGGAIRAAKRPQQVAVGVIQWIALCPKNYTSRQ